MSDSKSLVVDLTNIKNAADIEAAVDAALAAKAAGLRLQHLEVGTVNLNGSEISFAWGALDQDTAGAPIRSVDDSGNPNQMVAADATILADTTAGAVTVTLPAAADVPVGKPFRIMRTSAGANDVTVATPGSELINGAATDTLGGQWVDGLYISDGTNYYKFTG